MKELVETVSNLNNKNCIDYIIAFTPIAISILVIIISAVNNKKVINLTKKIHNDQIDMTLYNKKIEIYEGFMGVITSLDVEYKSMVLIKLIDISKDALLKTVINIFETRDKLTYFLNEAELVFDNEDLIEYLRNIRNLYEEYVKLYATEFNLHDYSENSKKIGTNYKTVKEYNEQFNIFNLSERKATEIIELLSKDDLINMFKKELKLDKLK